MTNNTIPNVPRELLERAATSIEQRMCIQCEGVPCCMPESLNTLSDIRAILSTPSPADHVEDVRAMVAAPSPAGVDGMEVVGVLCISRFRNNPAMENVEFQLAADVEQGQHDLCRLSDAQAIIDGLRGENERIRLNIAEYNEAISCYQSERDQQAQRIGELEGLLREVHGWIDESARVYRHNSTSVMLYRIDAALASGHEVPPCPH